ncbi:hypothetical protein OAS95_01175 [Pelagibacteraceae bacterium]|nr:hypothetical protein [Pelagibacteraceae bacterium]
MKVAVLITGQPISGIKNSSHIINTIIAPNNADVFMHMWYDKDSPIGEKSDKSRECSFDEDIDKQLLDIYKPKAYCIEKQRFSQFENYDGTYYKLPEKYLNNYCDMPGNKELTRKEIENRIIKYTHLSQFYSVFKCNMLKEEYSIENNVLYDCVIKIRYDTKLGFKLDCSNIDIDMNNLYYMNLGHKDNIISDWFNMGNSMIMNIYSSVFLNLKYLNDTTGIYQQTTRQPVTLWDTSQGSMGPEHMLRDLLDLYKIRYVKINGQCELEKS